jgi:hypothetical protein
MWLSLEERTVNCWRAPPETPMSTVGLGPKPLPSRVRVSAATSAVALRMEGAAASAGAPSSARNERARRMKRRFEVL